MTLIDTVAPESVGLAATQIDKIPDFLQETYIDSGRIAGCVVAVIRHGQVAHLSALGKADVGRDIDMSEDSIFRLYSMTKPITSIALMSLYEDGAFQLTDPVSRFIPEWADLEVYVSGEYPNFQTRPVDREMNIQDLLTHQSGLTYGFNADTDPNATEVAKAYKQLNLGMLEIFPQSLEELASELGKLPLLFSPGTHWNYSVSTDVCARLVEIISRKNFNEFIQERILDPVGMTETAYEVPDERLERFTANYRPSSGDGLVVYDDPHTSRYRGPVTHYAGGVGLTAPIGDYIKFVKMLLNGGTHEGQRIIGSRTLEFMSANHLPEGADMMRHGFPTAIARQPGFGFGLGFARTIDPGQNGVIGNDSIYFWMGAASTTFWVDPKEDIGVIYLTQSILAGLPTANDLKALIYPAIMD